MLKGYHKLILADGTVHHQVIVDMADDGSLLAFHTFSQEEPFVEWIGGTLDLSSGNQQ